MTAADREKLIEEAAKAIWEESTDPGRKGYWEDESEYVADEYANQARAALAVFEKAHAPEKDERLARYMAMATPLGYQSALTVVQEMTKLLAAEDIARRNALGAP